MFKNGLSATCQDKKVISVFLEIDHETDNYQRDTWTEKQKF